MNTFFVFLSLTVLTFGLESAHQATERHFTTSHRVWTATWISGGSLGEECDLTNFGETSHRLTHLKQSTIIKQKALTSEVDPLEDGHLPQSLHDDHEHNHELSQEKITTAYALSREELIEVLDNFCANYSLPKPLAKSGADKVTQIVVNGPPSNRIDVVLMGDGYQESEEQRMDADMRRLTEDMFNGDTFSAYLPVFNVWSVYRPSVDSGIGVGGRARNTAFGLYRDGTELRGVYCSKPAQARLSCAETGPDACDFPSLIGNDEYYGGLGGEFTISTRSETSGTMVLRHEMGHNFISVGEEYDGGQVYSGVNHSPTGAGTNVRWAHWLTEPDNRQIEGSTIRVQRYAWYNLAQGPYTVTFNSDGNSARWLMSYSISGCDTQNSFRMTLDGNEIPWQTRGSFDRMITQYFSENPLGPGSHTLVFRQMTAPAPGNPIRQLCSVVLIEYKAEPQFHLSNDYIGVYPTWRQNMVLAGYRPTNEYCLMRNMSSTQFCPVCYEGMWMQFFGYISAIDEVVVKCEAPQQASIEVVTVKLGQLREGGPLPGEKLSVKWTWRGQELPQFADQFSLVVPSQQYAGIWEVEVKYITPLVRSDPNELLTFTQSFNMMAC